MSAFTERSPSFRPMSSEVILTVGTADLIMVSVRLKKRKKKKIWKRAKMANDTTKTTFQISKDEKSGGIAHLISVKSSVMLTEENKITFQGCFSSVTTST